MRAVRLAPEWLYGFAEIRICVFRTKPDSDFGPAPTYYDDF
jgi:hypothetical protein